jgi:hypothetical protein
MQWHYESVGVWVAKSGITADDALLFWRVKIQKTGLFSCSQSDNELDASEAQFATAQEAMDACATKESFLMNAHNRCACGNDLHPGVDDRLCRICYSKQRASVDCS